MDTSTLRKANLIVRKGRPFFLDEKICNVFCSSDLIEIGFLSRRCSRDMQGACMMCDYGAARDTYSMKAYLDEMDRILESVDRRINILLLCTNGSFFDHNQINHDLFCAILDRAGRCDIPIIEIETHYQDVTREKLELLERFLPGKDIIIEMGLETVQPKYQENIIMKDIDLAAYEQAITLIQSFGFHVDVNIMVGLPFLSPKEQFEDALDTIRWSFAHRGRPVLFPVNIKPYTLLMEAYRAEFYRPISQWMLPLILDALPEIWLEQVTVAWYGDREEIYDINGERAIFPVACPTCSAAIRTFYDALPTISSGLERKKRLHQLMDDVSCKCLEQTRREITKKSEDTFEERYIAFLSWIARQNLKGKR